jgi:demethylmenaquinone methyltransferase/2-methoxy-6-polyprenyl-1,4-benzoquinol methylase
LDFYTFLPVRAGAFYQIYKPQCKGFKTLPYCAIGYMVILPDAKLHGNNNRTIMHMMELSMNKNTHPGFVKNMFGAIAPYYDFLNRLLSMRQDVYWRRQMVEAMELSESARVMDAACGTGDVMLEIRRQKPEAWVCGIDFSIQMLCIAGKKQKRHRPSSARNFLAAADLLCPPFTPESFDGISIAFGIRNVSRRKKALAEFFNLLKPGGVLAVLELSTPRPKALRALYLYYFKKILPAVGGIFSKNLAAYNYLPASVLSFPEPEAFAGLMKDAGFNNVKFKPLTIGIATLYIGIKPGNGARAS